jgi:hypothetical protein
VEPFTRQSGAWTISHLPAGHSAYDRVLGRLTSWSLEVAHETGWRMVEHEGDPEARVISPGGILVGVINPTDYAEPQPASLTAVRSQLLIAALTAWVHEHAPDYDEPDIAG